MELRQNIRSVTTRPVAWLTAILVALALGLISWYALESGTATHPTRVNKPPTTSVDTPRNGGPGGQFGDPESGRQLSVGGRS
jgi:hypothetical protein